MAKYTQFFQERIPNMAPPNDKGESVNVCIFHPDKSPSLAVNVDTGKWKCYTPHCPGHAGGGYKKFDKLLKGELTTAGEIKVPPIDASTVESFHHILTQSRTILELLESKRGITMKTVKKYKLGWDAERILIPIPSPDGSYTNVRKYKYGATEDKVIGWELRYNAARLFPISTVQNSQRIILFEGEMDTLLMDERGYPAVTSTGGADSWPQEYNELLRGKDIVFCYDVDKSGKQAAHSHARKLLPYANSVKIATLPLAGTKAEKDVTDYIVHLGHSNADFDAVLARAETITALVDRKEPPAEVVDIHLSRVGEKDFIGKRIRSTVLVAGKDLAPYAVPWKVEGECNAVGTEKACNRCALALQNGRCTLQMKSWSPELLEYVNIAKERLQPKLEDAMGVAVGCPKAKLSVAEYCNIESIKVIPEIDFSAEQSKYVIRNLFYIGHGIEPNHTYHIEAVVMPDPKTQYATALVSDAKPAQSSIEKFDTTQTEDLNIFKVDNDPAESKT